MSMDDNILNLLKPNDIHIYIYIYIYRNAALTSRRYILNSYSTNKHNEYFKHAAKSPFFYLQMQFISLCYLVWFLYYSHFTYSVC